MKGIEQQLKEYTRLTDGKLEEIFADGEMSPILRESMSYSVFAGGKRLRPALCMGACELLGGRAEDAVLPACAVEMIHAYSLIHDDLPALDNDDLRRGKPSNHKAFGEANAIIAGDGLQALAFLVAAKTGNPKVVDALATGAFDMVVGQSYDLTGGSDAAMLNTIHRLKTGALIKAAVLSGGHCGKATKAELAGLSDFAEKFGLLFQITDDILDATGDAEQLGKSIGKDAKEDKLTFVTLYGVDGARLQAKKTAEQAHKAVDGFGERSGFFHGLVDMTLDRRA